MNEIFERVRELQNDKSTASKLIITDNIVNLIKWSQTIVNKNNIIFFNIYKLLNNKYIKPDKFSQEEYDNLVNLLIDYL